MKSNDAMKAAGGECKPYYETGLAVQEWGIISGGTAAQTRAGSEVLPMAGNTAWQHHSMAAHYFGARNEALAIPLF